MSVLVLLQHGAAVSLSHSFYLPNCRSLLIFCCIYKVQFSNNYDVGCYQTPQYVVAHFVISSPQEHCITPTPH